MRKNDANYIRIKIKTIDSNIHEFVFDEINPQVKEIKKKVEIKLKIPVNKQRLIYQGKVLQDNSCFSDYKLDNDDVIHLVEQQEFSPNVNSTTSQNTNYDPFNFLGGGNARNSTFGDIFNMILQTTRGLNNNNPQSGQITNSYNNNRIPNNVNNNNLINIPEIGLGGLTASLLNIPNWRNQNNFNNTNNSDSFFADFEGYYIPESFKSLEKRTSFNKVETIEVIKQNINNVRELLRNIPSLNYDYFNTIKNIFTTNETSVNATLDFKIGQWIDAKDTLDIWVEAQIMDIKDNKAYVHFYGWGNTFNEWIKTDSPRLALFRTYTLQSPFSKYYSPFPNKKEDGGLILTNLKEFDNFENLHDLLSFIDRLREKIMSIILLKEDFNIKVLKSNENLYNSKIPEEQYLKFDKSLFFSMCQLTPMMDRIGRLLCDFSNYIFNHSFNKFENDYEKYKSNIGDSYNISNDRTFALNAADRVVNKKIHSFYNIIQIPNLRNPGEVAENQNLNRPRLGVVIGIQQANSNNPTSNTSNSFSQNPFINNDRRETTFDPTKLKISQQPFIEFNSSSKLFGKKMYAETSSQTLVFNKFVFYKNEEFSIINTNIKTEPSIQKKNIEKEEKVILENSKISYLQNSQNENILKKKRETFCDNDNNQNKIISKQNFGLNDKKEDEKTKEIQETETRNSTEQKKVNNEELISLYQTNSKMSLLKKLSEKNLINLSNGKTHQSIERITISKPFIKNQIKLKDTNKTPIVLKVSLKPNLSLKLKEDTNNSNNATLNKKILVKKPDANIFRKSSKNKI